MDGAALDSSRPNQLTQLQEDLLREFFARDREFFLTGGAALAGFHLGHRATNDLDLFAPPGADLQVGASTLAQAVAATGGTMESVRTFEEYRRFRVLRGNERCIVDLVIDRAPQVQETKTVLGTIRLDSPREILANKLCAVFGRNELRDLIDLKWLLGRDADLKRAVLDAQKKDGGIGPGALSWVVQQIEIPETEQLPDGGSPGELRQFRDELVDALQRLSFEETSA